MIVRVKNKDTGAASAGQDAAIKFWEFPFGVEVEAPDTDIEELERLARLFAEANWGMEFDRTAVHFRFNREKEVREFGVACAAMGLTVRRR
jgi:hypothetical protein